MAGSDLDQFRSSLVQVQIGNQQYDAHNHPGCHTCQHPARMLIEERVLLNESYLGIARQFSEVDYEGQTLPHVSWQSIRSHFKNGHMPVDVANLRRLSEKRAKEIGVEIEGLQDRFVDHVVLAQAVVSKTYEKLVKAEASPTITEGMAAAKFLHEIEKSVPGGMDTEAWGQAMTIYFETARQFMPDETWIRFTAALASNPILKAMEQKANTIEGEVVIDAD